MIFLNDQRILLTGNETLPEALRSKYSLVKGETHIYELIWPSCSKRELKVINPRCPHSKKSLYCVSKSQFLSPSICERCDERLSASTD